ncbi:MAG: Xaa-Pro peptidase family protein [Thermotogota bacterium]
MLEKQLVFPREEYESRIKRLQQRMAEQSLDVLLVFTPENTHYLCGYQSIGYSSFQCLAVSSQGRLMLLVREMELGCAEYSSTVDDIVLYSDNQAPAEALLAALDARKLAKGRVGVEEEAQFLTARDFGRVMAKLGRAGLPVHGLVEALRAIKSPQEIECLRESAHITEAGMAEGLAAVKAGVSENDIAAAMFHGCMARGGEYLSSQPIITAGRKSGVAHTTFHRYVLKRGDVALLELGGCYNRYTAALMRTGCVGEPPAEVRRMYKTCVEGLAACIAAIKPGVRAEVPHRACQAVIDDAGYTENFRKRAGYSVGVSFPPDWGEGHIVSLSEGDQTILQPGMVFHIPPALRRYGMYGVGVSETVLVTKTGAEILTHLSQDLVA